MASTLSLTQSELSAVLWSTHPSVDAMIKRSLLGKRASRSRTLVSLPPWLVSAESWPWL